MRKKSAAVFLVLLPLLPLRGALHAAVPAAAFASRLDPIIQPILSRPEFRHAFWGIAFLDLDTGETLYELNADKLFTPGSTTKLLTEGTALALLGPDYRFTTRIYRTGPVAANGVLNGDLVLVASGDPNLSGRLRPDGTLAFENVDHAYGGEAGTRAVPGDPLLVVRQLAAQVAKRGIRTVHGQVRVDASLFPEGERELGTGTVLSPIVVNDNVIDLTVGPGAGPEAPAVLTISPATSYVRFINRVKTGPAGSLPALGDPADVTDPDGIHMVTLSGSFPAGAAPILYAYAVPEPSRFAATVLQEALAEKGVRIEPGTGGSVASVPWTADQVDQVVAEHVSAPFREEVKVTLKVSQNLHASLTPKLLGALLRKSDAQTGFDLERDFLTAAGLDLSGAQQADGAGGDAHYTPAFMVRYLATMAKRPDAPIFQGSLPVLGRDGTLFDIQADSPAAGHVFAKTGTYATGDPLNRRVFVTGKGLAGYMTTAAGRHLAFALYVNNVAVSTGPDEVKNVVGQALGEVAAAAYGAEEPRAAR
ncbi:MAG TPA: D-alanyl-D-alanine carboxypeptidase/D-alanyl-D-alanine-endopeptidase [Thermoanaerobaculia bacterium]|jgi:D-alanyl-D-alanine carboxypeptidase/D-alanyl-D-alanine-endopeptidase (penicillin-binding protein 4)|nr:D-alanyl-D-alanine carboxypeptidase/D-alanyl-D-alanine-endopeptidase [Thermoanaerobaculia bacterium]